MAFTAPSAAKMDNAEERPDLDPILTKLHARRTLEESY